MITCLKYINDYHRQCLLNQFISLDIDIIILWCMTKKLYKVDAASYGTSAIFNAVKGRKIE
jgi:hypothetical protein